MSENSFFLSSKSQQKINSIEEFQKFKCTYVKYGNYLIQQEPFECKTCSTEEKIYICKECIETCHKNCETAPPKEESDVKFVCHCGKNMKHNVIVESKKEELKSKCRLYEIYSKFFPDHLYKKCTACSMDYCMFCTKVCHASFCTESTELKYYTMMYGENCEKSYCDCNHVNHHTNSKIFENIFLDHTKEMNIDFFILANYCFETGLLSRFVTESKEVLKISEIYKKNDYYDPNLEYDSINSILKLFLKNKNKCYYFHQKYYEIYTYEIISKRIMDFDITKRTPLYYYWYMEGYLIGILNFLYLDIDFKNHKLLNALDYLSSNFTDRMRYRNLLRKSVSKANLERYKIYSKYSDKITLNKIVLEICEFIDSTEVNTNQMINWCILKVVYFSLKLFIFDIEELASLIIIIGKYYDIIFENVNSIYMEENMKNWKLLNKILLLLAYQYNDLVLMNHIEKKKTDLMFIHQYSEHGEYLLKIMIKTTCFMTQYYERDNEYRFYMLILNESLKTFIITDNKYHSDLKSLICLPYKEYLRSIEIIDYSTTSQYCNLFLILKDFSDKINEHIKDYSMMNNNNQEFVPKITSTFTEFLRKMEVYLQNLSTEAIQQQKTYNTKFFNHLNRILPYCNDSKFKQLYEVFIECMIFLNLDESMSKLLIYLSNFIENQFNLEFAFYFISQFTLNDNGLKHLLFGDTMKRIIFVFEKFENMTPLLIFVLNILESLRKSQVNVKYKKQILELINRIFNYMQDIDLSQEKFKNEMLIIIKIFKQYNVYLDQEEFKKMKNGILIKMKLSNFINMEFFKSLFPFQDEIRFDLSIMSRRFNENGTDIEATKVAVRNKGKLTNENGNAISKDVYGEELLHINKNELPMLNNYTNEEMSINKKLLLDKKLFFSFVNIVTKSSFFVLENEKFRVYFEFLKELNDLEYIQKLLLKDLFSLRQRKIILKFILNFNLLEVLLATVDDDIYRKILTTEEYSKILEEYEEQDELLLEKKEGTKRFVTILNIYKKEFKNLPFIIYSKFNNKSKDVSGYIEYLILGFKRISNYFYSNKKKHGIDFSEHLTLEYYKVSQVFINNLDVIKFLLKSINNPNCKSEIEKNLSKVIKTNEVVTNFNKIDNFFAYEEIYKCVIQGIEYLDSFSSYEKYSLENNFAKYDKQNDFNFFTIGIYFEGEFYSFYKNYTNKTESNQIHDPHFKSILSSYEMQFNNFKNSNIMTIFNNINGDEADNYRKMMITYFKDLINKSSYMIDSLFIPLFLMITKLLYFNTEDMQIELKEILDEKFYKVVLLKIQRNNIIFKAAAKNFFVNNKYFDNINTKSKLAIQFLQLLGEDYCTNYHESIIKGFEIYNSNYLYNDIYIDDNKYFFFGQLACKLNDLHEYGVQEIPQREIKIFGYLLDTFRLGLDAILFNSTIHSELPNDNYLILLNNISIFLVEYCSHYDENIAKEYITKEVLDVIYAFTKKIIFFKADTLTHFRKKILICCKIFIMNIILSLIENGNFSSNLYDLNKNLNPYKVFEQIVKTFIEIINSLKNKKSLSKGVNLDDEEFDKRLQKLYIYNTEFQNSLKLKFCLLGYKYIKLLNSVYSFGSIDMIYDIKNISSFKTLKQCADDEIIFTVGAYNVYKFLNKIITKIEIRVDIDENKIVNKNIYYITPPITYLLSEQTKRSFEDDVDRTSPFNKVNSLITETDYFMFEMFDYYKDAVSSNKLPILKSIRMFHFEIINFIMICIHQILLFQNFYKLSDSGKQAELFTDQEKFSRIESNFILALIQLVYVIIVIIIWVKYYAYLGYQHLIMKKFKINFIIKHEENKKKFNYLRFTENFIRDNKEVLESINSDVGIWDKLNIICFDLIIGNDTINVFMITLACMVLYLATNHGICLIIPIFLITKLNALLTNIVYAVRLKWKQLALVIFFTYLLVYLFSWISFLYLYKVFNIDNALVPETVYILLILGF